jgi:phospholipid/cholesterol/gamma-HCH transport system permease protein
MPSETFLHVQPEGNAVAVRVTGDWVIANAEAIERQLAEIPERALGAPRIVFQCGGLRDLDTSGAWLLHRASRDLEAQGYAAELSDFRPAHERFIRRVVGDLPNRLTVSPRPREDLLDQVQRLGHWSLYAVRHLGEVTAFLGRVAETALTCVILPFRLRGDAVVANMQRAGVNAIPIVALLAFLISIVLAYQGATQLARFGAEIFTINMTAVSLLREMGPLLTAILVAGRSGSAFAAELGVMRLNEEIDAMRTMGMDPYEVLVLPRILALVIMLPLLTMLANLVGLAGGALAVYALIGIPLETYMAQVQGALTPWTFWAGIIKTPVFAFLIASTATFWGMRVAGSAASVGRATTLSVVQSIFLVIAADAVFSILFTGLGL